MGGADVRRGALDGLKVAVKSTSYYLTGSPDNSNGVKLGVKFEFGLSDMVILLPERLQRSHHLEEPEAPEHIASPRSRHIIFAAFYGLGVHGIRESERISLVFPQRPKVEVGKMMFEHC